MEIPYHSHAPEVNPYRMPKTITPPVVSSPSIAKIRHPLRKLIGTVTLNFPCLSAMMLGMVRPKMEAAFKIASYTIR